MKIKYLLMAAFVLPCAMFTSCGGDDSDEPQKVNVEIDSTGAILVNTDIMETIDPSFKPDAAYLQKTWHGEYDGWDDVQGKNTTISRELKLNPNGTYTNIIAGKLIDTGKDRFYKFESEAGTYSYSNGTITYTCRYDSVLNYRDQTYTVYNLKHIGKTTEKATYTEKADFSVMGNGTRRWITKDMYLQSLTDKTINIAFAMDPARSSDKPKE